MAGTILTHTWTTFISGEVEGQRGENKSDDKQPIYVPYLIMFVILRLYDTHNGDQPAEV